MESRSDGEGLVGTRVAVPISMYTILIIILVVALLGGGGFYFRG